MKERLHVVVRAAAPIPLGDEVEIHVVRHDEQRNVEVVILRHVTTSVVYGAAGVFDSRPVHPLIGDPKLYLSPRLGPDWTSLRTLRARVHECVVSNLGVETGSGDSYMAAHTSLLVEPIATAQAYR